MAFNGKRPGRVIQLFANSLADALEGAAAKLFLWRKLYQHGSLSAVSAGEAVVPASELSDALKQIRELQRMLGKKTMEAEVLKEAVEIARS